MQSAQADRPDIFDSAIALAVHIFDAKWQKSRLSTSGEMQLSSLQASALHGDLANLAAHRVALPCPLHSCSHIHRRCQTSRSVARCSANEQESSRSDSKPRKHCLGHPSSKRERTSALKVCAVADEVREAVAQNASAASADVSSDTSAQQHQTGAASTPVPSTSSAEQSATSQFADGATHSAEASQVVQDTATNGTNAVQTAAAQSAPPQPPQPKTRYRGFKKMYHSTYQGGSDNQTRQDQGPRPSRGPAPIPIPPEEADWLLPGRTVVGKVVYSNPNGFKVQMVNDPRVGG